MKIDATIYWQDSSNIERESAMSWETMEDAIRGLNEVLDTDVVTSTDSEVMMHIQDNNLDNRTHRMPTESAIKYLEGIS